MNRFCKIDSLLLGRIDFLINKGQKVTNTKYDSTGVSRVSVDEYSGFVASSLTFIDNLFGKESSYYKLFSEKKKTNYLSSCKSCIMILQSIKEDIENGWLISFKDIVSADLFSDFLDMAHYLLIEEYKDASAVILGSVLEEHLRKLCINNSIELSVIKPNGDSIPKKASVINSDLYKNGIYNALMHKNITAWLDLRNNAAHGQYNEYTKEQVSLMYQGILQFIAC